MVPISLSVDGSIATDDLADSSITNAKLMPFAVTSDKILNEVRNCLMDCINLVRRLLDPLYVYYNM